MVAYVDLGSKEMAHKCGATNDVTGCGHWIFVERRHQVPGFSDDCEITSAARSTELRKSQISRQ